MQAREKYKDIVLEGSTYRARKMTARTGSYVAWLVATHALPIFFESKLAASGAFMPSGRDNLSEHDFHTLQDYCLLVCGKVDIQGGVEVNKPVIHDTGRFNDDDLESDLVTVMALTAHALVFNIAPFFDADRWRTMVDSFRAAYPVLNQLIPKDSTPSSSVQ